MRERSVHRPGVGRRFQSEESLLFGLRFGHLFVMSQPSLSHLLVISLVAHLMVGILCGTKEMTQPCLIYLRHQRDDATLSNLPAALKRRCNPVHVYNLPCGTNEMAALRDIPTSHLFGCGPVGGQSLRHQRDDATLSNLPCGTKEMAALHDLPTISSLWWRT